MKTTVETINAMFAKRKPVKDGEFVANLKPIYCADGTSLSVQASRMHYCFPKNNEGPYSRVEVGFPSAPPPAAWEEYCTGNFAEKPCDTVYAQVPLDVVAQFINMHGGIKAEEAPATIVPALNIIKPRDPLEQKRYNLTFEDMGLKF